MPNGYIEINGEFVEIKHIKELLSAEKEGRVAIHNKLPNPCEYCECGWATVNTNGSDSCHSHPCFKRDKNIAIDKSTNL